MDVAALPSSRAAALASLRASPEFEPVAVTFKRVANILKGQRSSPVDPSSLGHAAEKRLHGATSSVSSRVGAAMERRDFKEAFASIAELRPEVDAFFESVMVMDEDPKVRATRIALVGAAFHLFTPLADLTKLS